MDRQNLTQWLRLLQGQGWLKGLLVLGLAACATMAICGNHMGSSAQATKAASAPRIQATPSSSSLAADRPTVDSEAEASTDATSAAETTASVDQESLQSFQPRSILLPSIRARLLRDFSMNVYGMIAPHAAALPEALHLEPQRPQGETLPGAFTAARSTTYIGSIAYVPASGDDFSAGSGRGPIFTSSAVGASSAGSTRSSTGSLFSLNTAGLPVSTGSSQSVGSSPIVTVPTTGTGYVATPEPGSALLMLAAAPLLAMRRRRSVISSCR